MNLELQSAKATVSSRIALSERPESHYKALVHNARVQRSAAIAAAIRALFGFSSAPVSTPVLQSPRHAGLTGHRPA